MNQVVRRGQAVHRTPGPWTATIHRLLDHLHENGVNGLPRPLGFDEQGREVLTYLPGTVPSYPMPSWVWSEDVLVDAGRRLAQIHQASAGFDTTSATWQLPAHDPAEVICLNDVAPYNMVFDEANQLTGFIDVDTALLDPGPGTSLTWPTGSRRSASSKTPATASPASFRRVRLELLCRAYAEAGDRIAVKPADALHSTIIRLEDLAAFTAARAADGAAHVADHVQGYKSDTRWVSAHLEELLPID